MFELQETKWAHVNPQEYLFHTVSCHRTATKAFEEKEKHYKRMKKICGNGWDHNHRVINTEAGG